MIKFQVSGNAVTVLQQPQRITSGTVGLRAEFAFDSQWEGLSKVAMFRAGDTVMTIANPEDGTVVPWEVLEKPNLWLQVGVYGVNGEGTVVIPTVWVNVCVIHTGVNPDDDPAIKPTLPIWQEIRDIATAAAAAANDHIAKTDNPHKITAEQLGAATTADLAALQEEIARLWSALSEEGQTDNWRWRKQSNGTAECWLTHTGNIINSGYTDIIYLPFVLVKVEEKTITLLPESQVSPPLCIVECFNQSGHTTENATFIEVQYGGPQQEGTIATEIYIRGTWR